MKKIVIRTVALLLLLAGCGQKKESAEPAKDTTTETLQSTLPVLENANNNTVVTKTLVLPTDENGVQQIQTITYKGKQFLTLTIQQKRQVSEELKNYIAEHGLEEAKTALKEEEDKDESVQAARKIPGFSLETTLLSETEIETKTSYDFQVLDVKKASEKRIFKKCWLGKSIKKRTRRVYRKSSCKWCDCPVKKSQKIRKNQTV